MADSRGFDVDAFMLENGKVGIALLETSAPGDARDGGLAYLLSAQAFPNLIRGTVAPGASVVYTDKRGGRQSLLPCGYSAIEDHAESRVKMLGALAPGLESLGDPRFTQTVADTVKTMLTANGEAITDVQVGFPRGIPHVTFSYAQPRAQAPRSRSRRHETWI